MISFYPAERLFYMIVRLMKTVGKRMNKYHQLGSNLGNLHSSLIRIAARYYASPKPTDLLRSTCLINLNINLSSFPNKHDRFYKSKSVNNNETVKIYVCLAVCVTSHRIISTVTQDSSVLNMSSDVMGMYLRDLFR